MKQLSTSTKTALQTPLPTCSLLSQLDYESESRVSVSALGYLGDVKNKKIAPYIEGSVYAAKT